MVEQAEVTIGELGRALAVFRQDYLRDMAERKQDMVELRAALHNLQMVSPAVYQANREADLRRIEQLELDSLTSLQEHKQTERAREQDRRRFVQTIVVAAVGWLVTIAIFITTLVVK